MRCLLVDDEPGIREGLAALLRRRGHEVRTAGDCAAAAAALAEVEFDCVVTDWRLPDGLAARFVAGCPCPVVAVSGHPEEVEAWGAVREVLTKPVAPTRLLQALAACQGEGDPRGLHGLGDVAGLPADVRAVLAAADSCLPAGAAAVVEDDGTFVVWRTPLRSDLALPRLERLGGDLRVLGAPGEGRVELRLCRDGRPDPAVPLVRADAAWPEASELAVDCGAADLSRERFAAVLQRAQAWLDEGRRVHFLDVPPAFADLASDWERAHGVPMRDPVGPRLPAVLVDLWS
ncbi:MAG: response regulator [Planctomycetes bacterium]|nr:response regulator [Planctomycetota bacterium]